MERIHDMFGIGRRFFYHKILKNAGGANKPEEPGKTEQRLREEAFIKSELLKAERRAESKKTIGRKTLWYSRVAALFMVAVLVAQMFSFAPGMFAGRLPRMDDLWMFPEIEYKDKTIYDGMTIPIGAEMNAKFEFLIDESAFPIEVFLPDVLRAEADLYLAAAFDIYGAYYPGAKVIVNEKDEIWVHFDAPKQKDEDGANNDGREGSGNSADGYECDESCDHDAGSNDNETAVSGTSGQVSFGENDENPDPASSENSSTGSVEPTSGNVNSGSENSSSNDTPISNSEPVENSSSSSSVTPTDADSNTEACNDEDGMSAGSSSASIFSGIGSATASANEGDSSSAPKDPLSSKYWIKFELPVFFDEDELPPQPDPEWDAYFEALDAMEEGDEEPELHIDPWLVDILNTEYDKNIGKHVAEFVEIVIEPEALEYEAAEAFGFEIYSETQLYRYIELGGQTPFTATVNWNDNKEDAETRPSHLPADGRYLQLQLYFIVDGMAARQPVTAALLIQWGAAANVTAANNILRVTPSRTGTTNNFWAYNFTLPAQLVAAEETVPGTWVPSGEPLNVTYSFALFDDDPLFNDPTNPKTLGLSIAEDYIIESRVEDPTLAVNTIRCTLKEVFVFYIEWKDGDLAANPGRYNTRPTISSLRSQLNITQLEGAAVEGGTARGSLSDGSSRGLNFPKDLDISVVPSFLPGTLPSDSSDRVLKTTILGMPAFNAAGQPFNYFITETGNQLAINQTTTNLQDTVRTPNATVKYEALYENVGNFSEEHRRTHNGGTLVNRLVGDAIFEATKTWLDDNAPPSTRPNNGRFLLNRYPDIVGRSYRNASPVQGAELFMGVPQNTFDIIFGDFSLTGAAGPLPRFDIDGQEYVYFVQELYDADPPTGITLVRGPGEYIGTAKYDEFPSATPIPRGVFVQGEGWYPSWWEFSIIKNKIYNGGELENLRVGSVDLSVTKKWVAAARQSMDSSVTVYVERRLVPRVGPPSHADNVPWPAVPKDLLNSPVDADDGEYTLSGFRAEVQEKTHDFAGLDKYDKNGVLYQYRVTESKINMSPPAVEAEIKSTQDFVILDGFRYQLRRDPIAGNLNDILLTNTLKGETEIRVRKLWNGGTLKDDITFQIRRIGGGGGLVNFSDVTLYWEDPVSRARTDEDVPSSFMIPGSYTWKRNTIVNTGDRFAGAEEPGKWLVITGLDRFDDKGREIEYRVEETSSHTNYHHSFNFAYSFRRYGVAPRTEEITDPQSPRYYERIGTVDASFINTPSSGVGRYVNVNKVWADDGDQNCRGSVTFGLYYRPGGAGGSAIWERVGGTTIYSTNDWMGYIHLPTTAPHDTAPYTDYIVVEESVAGATVGYTAPTDSTTGGTLSAIPQLAGYGLNGAYGVQLGQVRTSAHYYNVFATYRADTATTRPSYTFKNVRTGTVEINIEKKFNDANHHQSRVQRVQIDIQRRLNYTNESAFRTLTSADGFDGVVILQYPTLTYSSPTGASALPKYDEDGMLYHYRVIERYVDDMAIFSSGPDGYVGRHGSDSATYSGLGSYTLGDGHRYAVSIGFDPVWGDHTDVTTNPDVTPNTVPRPDYYKFTVTNQREDTIKGLTVHKLWHDVERSTENGRNPIEARQRPDINFRLWQNVGNDDPAGAVRYAGDGFAEHIWNTNRDSRNEYYWSCTFTDLPRYTSEGVNAGTEIFYFVDEPALPATSEYKTYYWNTVAANRTPVDAPTWIWSPTDLPNITDIKIHDVPSNATDLVSPGGAKLDKVRNNGIIVNRREADRDMHGRKIWENVPGGLSANAYPTITLTLMQQNKEHRRDNTPPNNALPANVDVNVPVPNINKPSLLNRATDFRFLFLDGPLAETEAKVDKYDDYGIYKKYRAYEVSQANGYFAPIYNDFTLDVTNRYNLNGPVITAEFTKVWDFGPYGSEPPNGLEPTANVELWRVMTDSGGNDIAATRARVRTASVTWTEDDPEQKVEFAEGTGLTRLLRYGFNGFPYRYFLIENMDGYTFEHENVASPDVDPGGLDPYHYEFEAENIYDGKTDGQNHLVLLHGHKDWVGDTYGPTGEYNFGTRPDNVSLRVFRAVMVGTTLSAFEEITSFVRIDWIDNGNQWTYTVNADNEKVGDESITDGQPSLHRYAVTSDPYIYYVEEVYPATNSGSPVAENHHYTADIADGSGNGTKITTGTAAGTGATSIAAGSVRVQVAEDSGNFIANFKNTLKTVEPEVIKAWQKKSGPDGTPVPMATSPSRDFELMLPSEITFKVQSRPAGAATWTDLMYSGTTTLVTKTFTRAELLAGLTGTATQSTLKLDIHLPENADLAGVIKREYRMIETHIGGDTDDHRVTGTFETLNAPSGNFPVTAYTGRDGGGLGGFTVTYTENGRVVNTIETMPIFIQKVWVDDNNRDGLRPGSTVGGVHIPGNMSFSIVRDGVVAQVKTVSLTPTLQESGTTFDVPAYQAGSAELSTYAVQELTGTAAGEANARTYYTMTADPSVPGANVISNIITVSPPATKNFALGDPDPTTKSATSTPNVPATTKSFIFVNSHDKIRFNLTVTKIWDDDGISNIGDDNENDITPTHIHLALQRRIEGTSWVNIPDASSPGTDQLDAIIVSDVNTNLAAVRIDRPSGGWAASTTHTWSNIIARHDAGARYFFQVVEVNCNCPDDNTLKAYKPHVTVTPVDGSITVSGTSGQYVNNLSRHVVMDVRMSNKLETTSLAVTKQWFNADGTPMGATQNPFAKMEEVEVQLLYRLANTTNPNPWLPVTGNTETLNAPGWTATFDNLPLENNKGVKYEYSVREIRIGTQSIAPDDKTPYYSWSRAVEDTKGLGTEEQSVVVKNTLLTRGDIFVYIVWEDFRNQDGLRPEDVNVGLIMDMDLGTNAKYDEKDIKFTGDGWAG
ncbi:MAG: Cna B-type domain-containing protein, partial [Oscillospiraceae bacterium]|nr:Cna B-type domain-containing protein [Oscillospiraceae bacterium]